MNKVRCVDCGYLALRKRSSREIVEAEQPTRDTAKAPIVVEQVVTTGVATVFGGGSRPLYVYEPRPHCFAGVWRAGSDSIDEEGILPRIQNARPCEHFVKWRQGFSPKEHAEVNALEEQRRWQHEESERQRVWLEKQEELSERRHRQNLVIAMLAAFLGSAATLLAVWLSK